MIAPHTRLALAQLAPDAACELLARQAEHGMYELYHLLAVVLRRRPSAVVRRLRDRALALASEATALAEAIAGGLLPALPEGWTWHEDHEGAAVNLAGDRVWVSDEESPQLSMEPGFDCVPLAVIEAVLARYRYR